MKIFKTATLLCLTLAAILEGCTAGNSPATPQNPEPSATPSSTFTMTPNPTNSPTSSPTPTPIIGVEWYQGEIYHSDYNGGTFAFIYLAVNGQAVTTAGVTLSGTFTGSPVPILFNNTYSISGKNYAYYQAAGFNWQPGQTYILTTVTTAGTAAATLTAPGGVTFAPLDSHGAVTQLGWGIEGSNDYIYVRETAPVTQITFDTRSVSSDADSPVTVPAPAYPGGSGGVYDIVLQISNQLFVVPGATVDTELMLNEVDSKTVTWN